jgi:hypothetical protein
MRLSTALLAAATLFVFVAGCTTKGDAGVKSDYKSQWTTVSADTKATTDAAKAVLAGYDFKDVQASSTDVDGKATGKKADGTEITVSIKKVDNGSQVSVDVGTLGDPSLGAAIAEKIRQKVEAK